jgi:signal transduction histidine kinase
VTRHLSARSRLTLLYTSLFAAGGIVLVTVTYLLLANNLHKTAPASTTSPDPQLVALCNGSSLPNNNPTELRDLKAKCASLYANAVKAGAHAQGQTSLHNLLLYSLITLGAVTVLAAIAGWLVAGRILRPVHQLTAAARAASEQDLTHRLSLQGRHDELRELADTFDEMLDRLDRAFASQRQFIANASHELRTPLTVMRTSVDVVLAKPAPTPSELIGMGIEVRMAVDRAELLIDALLTLARVEGGRSVSDPLDLATIAEDALDRRTANGLVMREVLEPGPVVGDGVLLERLVGNLLDNAEQYNVPGGSIAITTAATDDTAVLRVVNTGPVIPPDQVDRLFLPFTRLDDRTRHDGFGLGLALVSSITAAHAGTVSAATVPTGGLDVTVCLPRRPSDGLGPPELPELAGPRELTDLASRPELTEPAGPGELTELSGRPELTENGQPT